MSRLIFINAVGLEKSQKGVGRYASHIIQYLRTNLPNDYKLLIGLFEDAEYVFEGSENLEIILLPRHSELLTGLFIIPRYLHKYKIDLVINTAEFSGPIISSPKFTVCHDINELIWAATPTKENLWRKMLNRLKQSIKIKSLKNSQQIFCNSEFVKENVINRYGADIDKTKIAYCGVDERFYSFSERIRLSPLSNTTICKNYILCFATGDPRENYTMLPEILAHLKNMGNPALMLVAGVQLDADYVNKLRAAFKARGLKEYQDYQFNKFLIDSDFETLVSLYTNADFYLELSAHEGFGMQLLEAMACGTTCLSSGCGALAEVGNKFTLPIKSLTPMGIAQAIMDAYSQQQHIRDNSSQIVYSRRFNWNGSGQVILEQIKNLLA